MAIKNHYFQVDENGVLHLAFVGTEEELQAQIDKEYAEHIAKTKETLEKTKKELEALKVDLNNITLENLGQVRQFVLLKGQVLHLEKTLNTFKKPSVQDGTYFVINKIGKDLKLEEHK